MTSADPAVGRDPEPLILDWDILPCLWDLFYFSRHSKPSMTILGFSISWRICSRKATFCPNARTKCSFQLGGGGGIRTHEPLRTTWFRVRLVMTTSIHLRGKFIQFSAQITWFQVVFAISTSIPLKITCKICYLISMKMSSASGTAGTVIEWVKRLWTKSRKDDFIKESLIQ